MTSPLYQQEIPAQVEAIVQVPTISAILSFYFLYRTLPTRRERRKFAIQKKHSDHRLKEDEPRIPSSKAQILDF